MCGRPGFLFCEPNVFFVTFVLRYAINRVILFLVNFILMIKILVPVNFYGYSLNALSFGLSLAEKFPAEITVLHCFPIYEDRNDQETASPETVNAQSALPTPDQQEQAAEEKLKTMAQHKLNALSANQKSQIAIKYRFEYGYPEDVIPQVSRQYNPDVIIMGTKTKGETIKELLGSITGDVIQRVTAPVLAVPAHSAIDLSRIGKVLFLTEFDEHDFFSMHRLIRIMTPFDTEIHAVHFCHKKEDPNDLEKLERFKEYCETTYRNHRILFHMLAGKDFVKSMEDYARENQIDIIAMTRKKRSLLNRWFNKGITRRLLFHTDLPLLVFHS